MCNEKDNATSSVIDHQIAILQAIKDGKEIQRRLRHYIIYEPWDALPSALKGMLDFSNYEYRIKPEKKVVYVNFYPHGYSSAHESREAADRRFCIDRIARVRIEYEEGQFDD